MDEERQKETLLEYDWWKKKKNQTPKAGVKELQLQKHHSTVCFFFQESIFHTISEAVIMLRRKPVQLGFSFIASSS